ncbi:MAG TPA: aldehyde dehydrogenase (NADP(+)) [Lacibacter sp.]|nr:aldehyde dehydrogenase (NADP(+)) [Lacibacter sp.]
MFSDFTLPELDQVLQKSRQAFVAYRQLSTRQRAAFLRAIATELEKCGDQLLHTAMQETHLPEARLRAERSRTLYQLTSYADACERGDWMEISIEPADDTRMPPRPDLRKMRVPLGPVVVFGASNFPLAYSTAGGDTASALAAGCTVVVKAHPAHPRTSHLVADAILNASAYLNMPGGVFQHVYGAGFETGKYLVQHPYTCAVGFTGSRSGGKQMFDWAMERPHPIPVFAEMGSINPVFLFPYKLAADPGATASMYAASITLGVGQYCTNPGLLIGVEGMALQQFMHDLGRCIQQVLPAPMLHPGIVAAYKQNKGAAILQEGVHLVAESEGDVQAGDGLPTVATVDAVTFLSNPLLHQEVFGPFSLVVRCKDMDQMLQVAGRIEGQLTATIMATPQETQSYAALIDAIRQICGRIIYNGVPTGVEVCTSMQHGGPWPATTDSRFTAVGGDALARFARPLCYQGWPNDLLPDALKNENPLALNRRINNEWTRAAI